MLIKKELATHENFNEISNILLNKSILIVKDKKFRLCEIEFYYCDNDHKDDYTHCSDDQLDFGIFYFHKYKNGTYKSGTYKGLDLTFGNREKNTYFGILIRSIMDLDSNEFTEGPCKCVNKILEQFNFTTVNEFMNNKPSKLNIYDEKYEIYLSECDLKDQDIFVGPRVGLSDKYPEYLNKNYRYAILTKSIKKQKKFEKIKI